MAMYDWNGNGKNDMVDNFIEYKLSGCDSEDNQENYHYSNNSSSGSGLKVIVIGFFAMVYLFFIENEYYDLLDMDVELEARGLKCFLKS